jgi:hypothetical protein
VLVEDSEESIHLEAQKRLLRTQSQYEKLFESLNTVLVHRFEPCTKEHQEYRPEIIFVLQSRS